MLYNEVRQAVRSTRPILGSLPDSGHQEGASFLFFLKPELDVSRTTGAISVTSRRPGLLYVDDVFHSQSDRGTHVIHGMPSGGHHVRILYHDGSSEAVRVEVEAERVSRIDFRSLPPLPPGPRGYLSSDLRFSLPQNSSDVPFEDAASLASRLDYVAEKCGLSDVWGKAIGKLSHDPDSGTSASVLPRPRPACACVQTRPDPNLCETAA